ncbi:hypothetical protein J4206_06745 [Candidatus Woesearchaeota archaeon]|nr:hypothetical protein [Candidatus Woesearchaeota archaeon]
MKKRNILFGILILVAIILISGCIEQANDRSENSRAAVTEPKQDGQDCNADSECSSGVCDFIKQDGGECAPSSCTPGSQAQGISDVTFFCNQDNQWQKIKNISESCTYDYECFRKTGKDCPSCHPEDYRYSCKNSVCAEEKLQDECEKRGLKRILTKEESDNNRDGTCYPSMAQRQLFTVCAPCGNKVCDTELESKCNCPEDCE